MCNDNGCWPATLSKLNYFINNPIKRQQWLPGAYCRIQDCFISMSKLTRIKISINCWSELAEKTSEGLESNKKKTGHLRGVKTSFQFWCIMNFAGFILLGSYFDQRCKEGACSAASYRRRCESHVYCVSFSAASAHNFCRGWRCNYGVESSDCEIFPRLDGCP